MVLRFIPTPTFTPQPSLRYELSKGWFSFVFGSLCQLDGNQKSGEVLSRSLTVCPQKITFPMGKYSSNHHFSGVMLNFVGGNQLRLVVYGPSIYMRFFLHLRWSALGYFFQQYQDTLPRPSFLRLPTIEIHAPVPPTTLRASVVPPTETTPLKPAHFGDVK